MTISLIRHLRALKRGETRYADTDGDGKLTLSEFVELIRQMRIGVSTEAAAELFTMLDVDFNGGATMKWA